MRTSNLAIVFVDIAGYTERTGKQSRAESEIWLRRYESLLLPLIRTFGGKRVKTNGDAYLCTFASPTNALLFGMAAQDRLYAYNRTMPESEQIHIRVAVNAGEVRLRRGDVFGEPVNIAARVESITPPGEIWFTEAVYLAMTRSEVPAREVGVRTLKGISEPVRIHRVPSFLDHRMAGTDETWPDSAAEDGSGVGRYPYMGLGLLRAEERGFVLGDGLKRWRRTRQGAAFALTRFGRGFKALPRVVWPILTAAFLAVLSLLLLWPGDPFDEVLNALEDGHAERAHALLTTHPEGDTPAGRAALAHILLHQPQPKVNKAADLLAQATEQQPSLLEEKRVIADLILSLDRRNALATVALVAEKLGATALDGLIEASADKRYWLRWNSVRALQRLGETDHVDFGLVYILDLKHAGSCSTRKQAALKLAELKEPRALEPLLEAQNRRALDNLCMAGALDEAIRTIRDE